MSCQIKGIANITNTSNIKELLFGESGKRRKLQCSFVLSDIETSDVNCKHCFLGDIPQNELPLQDCFISLSSAGDVLAMAYNTKMIILVCTYTMYILHLCSSNIF